MPIQNIEKPMVMNVKNANNIRIERIWAMPNKNTFEILPIKALLDEEVDRSDFWIDPFANKNQIASVTNDLNPEYNTDYHMDALEFLKLFDDCSVDGVLYDPPYSPRQVSECYNDVGYNVTWDTTKASFWGNHKREISRIVKIGGKVITFGWNSGGIGYKYGFEIARILLVPHGGWHNDTICTVEVKTHEGICPRKAAMPLKMDLDKPVLTKRDAVLVEKLKSLPLGYWDFREDDTKEFTHGIHSYPAMMVCPISRNIIRLVQEIEPVHALFDPFAGSGTVLVEGMLSGIETVAGNDINPLALLLSKAKTTPIPHAALMKEAEALMKRISDQMSELSADLNAVDSYMSDTLGLDLAAKKGWGDEAPKYLRGFCAKRNISICVPDFKNLGYWFRPRVALELSIIKTEIKEIQNNAIRDFFFVAFSECIRFVSNRRNGEFKMFRMPAQKLYAFCPDTVGEFSEILYRNIEKMKDFCEALTAAESNTDVTIFTNDSRTLEDVPSNTYDLVITSPPYGDSRTTVAYGEYSRLSLQWIYSTELSDKDIMGLDKTLMGGRKYRNGFEFTLKSDTLRDAIVRIKNADIERAGDVYSFYTDLDASIRSISSKTRSGGYQFWVVGNRTVKDVLLRTDTIITELAIQYDLTPIFVIDRNISNKSMPSKNSPTNIVGDTRATMTTEHIVVLRKN